MIAAAYFPDRTKWMDAVDHPLLRRHHRLRGAVLRADPASHRRLDH